MCLENFMKLRIGFMSYQQCTRFRTTQDFDREYLWNGSSNRQTEIGVINHVWWNNLVNFGLLTQKMTLTFDIWPWNLIGFVRLLKYKFVQNFIKLRAAVHELSCWQREKNSDVDNTVSENSKNVACCQQQQNPDSSSAVSLLLPRSLQAQPQASVYLTPRMRPR